MKAHRISEYRQGFQPAYLSNGLIGLRIGANPLAVGKALVNGFVGTSPTVSHESYNQAPYPVAGNIIAGSDELAKRPDLFRFVEQICDFRCGELVSCFEFASEAAAIRAECLTFCSRTLPPVVAQQVKIETDRPCELIFEARMDPQFIPGRALVRKRLGWCADAVLLWEGRGGLSTCGAAYDCEFCGEGLIRQRRNDWGLEEDMQLTAFTVRAEPGRPLVFRQYGALVPSVMHGEPHWQAARMVEMARTKGFDALREENRFAWSELWRARPVLVGADDKWQDVVDAAFFYLHSSVHPSMPCSVAPFGLSDEFNYHGHVFWDAEGWMFPACLLTDPESARAMLDYRFRTMEMAGFHARLHGYRGLMYPNQTANTGSDVTTLWARDSFNCGVGLEVAHAFAAYAHATGDRIFEREKAWPVVKGVADWIVSRVRRTRRGYEMPYDRSRDEQWLSVHNCATTLGMAKLVLCEASAMAQRLGYEPPAVWREIGRNLFFPIDADSRVLLKFEGWKDERELCGMEIAALYEMFPFSIGPEVDRATIDYYLDRADRYLGMPMFSVHVAAMLARYRGRAAGLAALEKGLLSRVRPPFLQFCECSKEMGRWNSTDVTLFLTDAAGVVHTVLQLMTGLRPNADQPAEWLERPPALPEGWDAIEAERIWVRGHPARLSARHGEARARLEVDTDEAAAFPMWPEGLRPPRAGL